MNGDALFIMLGSDQYKFDKKKCDGTRYTELVFMHPVVYSGHIVMWNSTPVIHPHLHIIRFLV
jgi:hypothetical protein